jgi:hypothetical protein
VSGCWESGRINCLKNARASRSKHKANKNLHHEAPEGHEEFRNYYISISYFVGFVPFVVL